jgi:hypothetical protein
MSMACILGDVWQHEHGMHPWRRVARMFVVHVRCSALQQLCHRPGAVCLVSLHSLAPQHCADTVEYIASCNPAMCFQSTSIDSNSS